MAAPQRDTLPEAGAIIAALSRLREDAELRCEALRDPLAALDRLGLTGRARQSLALALSTASAGPELVGTPAAFIFW